MFKELNPEYMVSSNVEPGKYYDNPDLDYKLLEDMSNIKNIEDFIIDAINYALFRSFNLYVYKIIKYKDIENELSKAYSKEGYEIYKLDNEYYLLFYFVDFLDYY